jgi:type IV pilus assembly protein PilZ
MKGWRMDHSIVLGADPSPLATVLADRPDQESLKVFRAFCAVSIDSLVNSTIVSRGFESTVTAPMLERESQRIPYTVKVEFRTASSFLVAYSLNVSRGGLFLETEQDVPVGAAVNLEFLVPGMGGTEVRGHITWRRGRGSLDGPPGIGIETIDRLVTSFAGLVIVLVTSDRQDRATLTRSIKSIMSTAAVKHAADYHSASELLTSHVDLLVVDVDCDVDDALATLRTAKAMHPPVPTVALASKALRDAAKEAGADEVVANPPPFTELQLSMVRALGKPLTVR